MQNLNVRVTGPAVTTQAAVDVAVVVVVDGTPVAAAVVVAPHALEEELPQLVPAV